MLFLKSINMLDDYFSILAGKKEAKYLKTKKISIKINDYNNFSISELWNIHENINIEENRSAQISENRISLLELKTFLAKRILDSCCFCERRCGKNRSQGELGTCRVGIKSRCSSEFLHMGEEMELVPSHTIFFSGCTFKCCYCQNWDIAMYPKSGAIVEPEKLVKSIKNKNKQGSRNVNFVGGNPDPHLHTILQILKQLDLNIPIVWNSNMYASIETMKILNGLVDVFLGDFRYGNDKCAQKYSKITNYTEIVQRNFSLAIIQSEVMLRHLVLPGHLDCCTEPIIKWVSKNMPDVYFNLMFQYRPCYQASEYPEINRILSEEERKKAIDLAEAYQINFR